MNIDENNNKNVNKNEKTHSEKENEIILEDYINNIVQN
jgi:hypothetical protein